MAAHRLDFTRIPADYGDPAADQALAVDVAAGRRAPASRMHDYLAARTSFFDRTVTGWQVAAGVGNGRQAAAGRDRLRAAGLLLASAGPAGPAQPQLQSRPHQTPHQPSAPGPPQPPQSASPLPALLSQALVAFTIEFDNEAEHRLPHRTTSHGASAPGDGAPAPWLVSLVMWENCMRYVTDEPITVGDHL